MALPAGRMAIHAVEVENLTQALMRGIERVRSGEVYERVRETPHRVMQGILIGLSHFRVALRADAVYIG